MNTILPPHITVDAVPERRTVDEENQPPAEEQLREAFTELENASRNKNNPEKNSTDQPASSNENDEKCPKTECSGSEKKSKSKSDSKKRSKDEKRRSSKSNINVINITGCHGFHYGNKYQLIQNLNGASNGIPKSQNPSSESEGRPKPNIPPKVFYCYDSVTENDCIIVSGFITCGWRTLGNELFCHQMDKLDHYVTHLEKETKKEAVRLILISWKQKMGQMADVASLSKVLQKLDELKALMELALQHKIFC